MVGLNKLFEDTLRDVYYAEKQIYKALPKMIKAATHADLKAGFEKHREETQGQIERLEKVFEMLEKPARGKKCPAIDGILEEGAELIEEHDRGPGLDAALAGAAQAVEHYEIACYGTMCCWAEALGRDDLSEILGETLNEEEVTDETLSELAISTLNPAAIDGADAEEGDGDDDSAAVPKPALQKKGVAGRKPDQPSGKMADSSKAKTAKT